MPTAGGAGRSEKKTLGIIRPGGGGGPGAGAACWFLLGGGGARGDRDRPAGRGVLAPWAGSRGFFRFRFQNKHGGPESGPGGLFGGKKGFGFGGGRESFFRRAPKAGGGGGGVGGAGGELIPGGADCFLPPGVGMGGPKEKGPVNKGGFGFQGVFHSEKSLLFHFRHTPVQTAFPGGHWGAPGGGRGRDGGQGGKDIAFGDMGGSQGPGPTNKKRVFRLFPALGHFPGGPGSGISGGKEGGKGTTPPGCLGLDLGDSLLFAKGERGIRLRGNIARPIPPPT